MRMRIIPPCNATVLLCLLVFLCSAGVKAGGMLFYASYDRSTSADFAVADPRDGTAANSTGRFELVPGRGGKWSKALDAPSNQRGRSLRYGAQGNIDFSKGTIELFARVDEFGTNWQEHRFFVAGDKSYGNVLELGFHPQGEFLVFSWKFNEKAGWFHAKKIIKLKQWQHYAMTWDMTGAAGTGTVCIYIDGRRCTRVTGIAPFDVAPQGFHIGCGPKGAHTLIGQLDDLAVFSDIRYTGNFAPRTLPLADEVERAVSAAKALIGREVEQARAELSAGGTASPNSTIVANGGFEQWADGKPVAWETSHGHFAADTAMKVGGASSLRMATDRMQKATWLNTGLKQRVTLRPHTDYRLRFWAAKDGTGDVRASLRALRDGKPVGQATVSYTTAWTSFFVWTPIEVPFRTGSENAYELGIRQYGAPPAPVWIDQVAIELVGEKVARPTPTDLKRGFQLFSQSIMLPFDERSMPGPDAVIESVRILMAKGEYEPGLLAIHALRNLRDVDLRLSGDLMGPGRAKLSRDDVVIREYRQSLLPPSRPRFAGRDANLAWWVTVRTAADSPAGIYTGALQVVADDEVRAEIPLTVEVLNIALPQPDIAYAMYHAEAYFPDSKFLTETMRRAYYRDMREHGMNTVTVYNTPDVDGRRIDFGRNYKYPPDDPVRKPEFGLDKVVPMILESGLCASGEPIMWLVSKNGEYGFGGASETATRAMLEEWLKRKWPTPLLYVHDEPSYRERIDAVKPVLERIKSWKLPVKTVTAGLDIEELGSLYDVWVQSDSTITYKIVQEAQAHGAELWTYNCNVAYSNAPFPRAFFGFCAYRNGVKGVAQWAYYDAKNWVMDADGTVHGSNNLSRVCLSPTGPVPTVSWEATREGIDDYRYAMRFSRLLKQAEQEVEKLAAGAAKLLSDEDARKIEQREKQLERKFDPKVSQARWKAVDEKQAEGERMYLAARNLRRELRIARRAHQVVIMTIPFDAMAPKGALPFGHALATYYPVLGLGDPRTVAEQKRRILISHTLRLQQTLRAP
ncbi:MAG: LamG domain-containing protein [Lentisphaeria bacterium]|nr:LamG domain-containing protein [Lentisphaeria bacterium]